MKKKTKKPKLSLAKKKAWSAFSLYIRTRDCIKTTGYAESGRCITCLREYPRLGLGGLQAGHFVPGRTNAVLFDERGVHAQCYSCNIGKGGAGADYWLFMEREYGREVIDELLANRHQMLKYTAEDYRNIQQKYEQKTKELMST